MKIAVIGAGNVGTALGTGWTKAGHQITYGVRNPQDDKVRDLIAAQPRAKVASNADASRDGDVIVFSTPWGRTEAAIRDCGSLAGKIVIDATNPLKADFTGLACGFNTSGGEQVAQWAVGSQVFKTMNQVGFGLMDHPALKGDSKPVMFVAGDGAGKPKVLQLVSGLGFEAIDVGDSNMPVCLNRSRCFGFTSPSSDGRDSTSPSACCVNELMETTHPKEHYDHRNHPLPNQH